MASKIHVADLTVDELVAHLREELQELVRQEVREALTQPNDALAPEQGERSLMDWEVFDLGPWPEGLTLRREEMYGGQVVWRYRMKGRAVGRDPI